MRIRTVIGASERLYGGGKAHLRIRTAAEEEDEIDMAINIRLKDGNEAQILHEIKAIKEYCAGKILGCTSLETPSSDQGRKDTMPTLREPEAGVVFI